MWHFPAPVLRGRSGGYSLIELIVALVLVGIVASTAVPSLASYLQRRRVQTALDRVTADLYFARAAAARLGAPVRVRFTPIRGCAETYQVRTAGGDVLRTVRLDLEAPGVCVRSNVRRDLIIDSRGMLVGSQRKLRATSGSEADSLSISLVGRVYRWY